MNPNRFRFFGSSLRSSSPLSSPSSSIRFRILFQLNMQPEFRWRSQNQHRMSSFRFSTGFIRFGCPQGIRQNAEIISIVRKHIMTGGPTRFPFTVPPVVFSALKLIHSLQRQHGDLAKEDVAATPNKIFQLITQTIEALSYVPAHDVALRLYSQCAEAANNCNLESITYEFLTQAFLLYEEEIVDSKAQLPRYIF